MLYKIFRLEVLIIFTFIFIASIISFGLLGGFNYNKEIKQIIEPTATPIVFITATSVPESITVQEDDLIRYIDINSEATLICTHLRIDDVVIEKINCND